MKDFTFTVEPDGAMLAHRTDCPLARRLQSQGEPVLTMIGCQLPLRDAVKRHSCLELPV